LKSVRFDSVTRAFSLLLTRRGLAGALGLAAIAAPNLAVAKRKKRKKKIKRNEFGCVNVGNFCKDDGQCCSGICEGKKCKGHDQGTCQLGQDVCAGDDAPCTQTAGGAGECLRTTGNAGYCAGEADIYPCTKDADCVPFCGPRAACIVCAQCAEVNPNGTICAGLIDDGCTFPESDRAARLLTERHRG
jgi:hypothetical protein